MLFKGQKEAKLVWHMLPCVAFHTAVELSPALASTLLGLTSLCLYLGLTVHL